MKETYMVLGTMTGTSKDGIDVACIITDGQNQIKDIGHFSIEYDPRFALLLNVSEYIFCITKGDKEQAHNVDFYKYFFMYCTSKKMSEYQSFKLLKKASLYLNHNLDMSITLSKIIQHSTFLHEYAIRELIKKINYTTEDIDFIGYHGQTLYHNPKEKITIQVGNAQQLADALGITVIHDFRSMDVALGGQGAPLAPIYHLSLANRDNKLPLAVVNCGGIANISIIPTADYQDLKGYDTGPGNGLIDSFVKYRTKLKESMDLDGKYGLQGKVNENILEKLYAKAVIVNNENYFDILPPKSLDINNLMLIPELDELSIEDGCATLAAFTADSIIKNITRFTSILPKHWVLVGGGWYNPVITAELKNRIKNQLGAEHKVYLAQEIGWNNKAMEAQIFAFLAVRAWKNLPISVPETTGVSQPITFAKICTSNTYAKNIRICDRRNVTEDKYILNNCDLIYKSFNFHLQAYTFSDFVLQNPNFPKNGNLNEFLMQNKEYIFYMQNLFNRLYIYVNLRCNFSKICNIIQNDCITALDWHTKTLNLIKTFYINEINYCSNLKSIIDLHTPEYNNLINGINDCMVDIYVSIGDILHRFQLYELATQNYFIALNICENFYKIKYFDMLNIYLKIGDIFYELKLYLISINYYYDALLIYNTFCDIDHNLLLKIKTKIAKNDQQLLQPPNILLNYNFSPYAEYEVFNTKFISLYHDYNFSRQPKSFYIKYSYADAYTDADAGADPDADADTYSDPEPDLDPDPDSYPNADADDADSDANQDGENAISDIESITSSRNYCFNIQPKSFLKFSM